MITITKCCKILTSINGFNQIFVRQYSAKKKDVYITSAVRTPIAEYQTQLGKDLTHCLRTATIAAATKQGAVLQDDIDHFYLGDLLWDKVTKSTRDLCSSENSSKKSMTISNSKGIKAVLQAIESLELGTENIALAGGLEQISSVNGIILKNCQFDKSQSHKKKHAFKIYSRYDPFASTSESDVAIVPIVVRQKGHPSIKINKDKSEIANINRQSSELLSGFSSILLTTKNAVDRFQLSPLARIIDHELSYMTDNSPTEIPIITTKEILARNNLTLHSIDQWALNQSLPLLFHQNLQIDFKKCNLPQNCENFIETEEITGACLLSQLTHSLQPGELGFLAVQNNGFEIVTILLEKMNPTTSPLMNLTLYTKDPCQLCDDLVEELESKFLGQYDLKKVYITEKENLRFLRLYRYDIPVLFLNGQFLCMHRLNSELMYKKLNEITKNKKRFTYT